MKLRYMFLLGVCLLTLGCGSFTEPETASKVLESQGYTHIQITGYRYFICGNDTFSTGFKAVSPTGQEVSGAVCAGWMKGHTIRFDDPN